MGGARASAGAPFLLEDAKTKRTPVARAHPPRPYDPLASMPCTDLRFVIESKTAKRRQMSPSTFTLEQRIVAYAFDAFQDPRNLRAMTTVVEMARSRDSETSLKAGPPRRGAVLDTGLKRAILKTLPTIKGDFSLHEVRRKLRREHYPFSTANPDASVSKVLRKLCKERILALVKKGAGGKPSAYRFAG
jgi:hypothetical protein